MEFHSTVQSCPQFKFEVIDRYTDPLRRQLCQGLNILSTGTMNRKMEFHENLICRMEPGNGSQAKEDELKTELVHRRLHRDNMQEFNMEYNRIVERGVYKDDLRDSSIILEKDASSRLLNS